MVTPLNASVISFLFARLHSLQQFNNRLQREENNRRILIMETKNNYVEQGGGRGGKSPPATAVKQTHAVKVVRIAAPLTSAKPFKKVQVVYYLTRHGHLDHPHYMELTLLTQHQLRLRGIYIDIDACTTIYIYICLYIILCNMFVCGVLCRCYGSIVGSSRQSHAFNVFLVL